MQTLLISTWSLPSARSLAMAAGSAGWDVLALDDVLPDGRPDSIAYYGGSDVALRAVSQFQIKLLEPPLDLLTRLSRAHLQRTVEFATLGDLHRLHGPTFVKPSDSLNKAFDAGIYSRAEDILRGRRRDINTPVVLSEPVEWLAEYRCFILDRKIAASSPCLNFGRPTWKPYATGGKESQSSIKALSFCEQFLIQTKTPLPPAFVVDVGLIEDRGWAVVEFNPVWCSGLLGADPRPVLNVLARASRNRKQFTELDERWVITRGSHI